MGPENKPDKFWDRGPMVVTGCTKVSRGCERCWSEQAHVMRAGRPAWPADCLTDGRFNGKVHFRLEALTQAVKGNTPRVIALWNDLYHKGVTLKQLQEAYNIMDNDKNRHHTFLIITKRIDRAADFCAGVNDMTGAVLPDNMIHFATMEDQKAVDARMPHLLRIPGKRGIIIEPMVERLSLVGAMDYSTEDNQGDVRPWMDDIHQVILGGETGPGAVPMHPDWVRSVRDQCQAAGMPFFFKSWGEWKQVISTAGRSSYVVEADEPDTYYHKPVRDIDKVGYGNYEQVGSDEFIRVGKKVAGRVLDGRTHDDLVWRD